MNKFFKTTRGGTRYIVLIGNLVFKFPYFKCIPQGRLQNRIEWRDRNKSKHLARLYFAFPFGLCNIMERVIPISEPFDTSKDDFIKSYFKDIIKDTNELRFILKDGSTGNFGLRNGELVKLDWGGYGK